MLPCQELSAVRLCKHCFQTEQQQAFIFRGSICSCTDMNCHQPWLSFCEALC